MAEDLQTNISNYKLQLQQVEAALTTDPANDELLKLQHDLKEVLGLTEELLKSQLLADAAAVPGSSSDGASSSNVGVPPVAFHWTVGDRCMAVWSEDHQTYEATIDEILPDGTCTVTFDEYNNTEIIQMAVLKPVDNSIKRNKEGGAEGPPTKKSKREQLNEYKKKKQQKKQNRQKAIEEERETEKNKWVDFNAKLFTKQGSKGRMKKSIFATPDAATGRVGVGTCGIGGTPMTQQQAKQDKWKKYSMATLTANPPY